ncbi:DUF962 domain-containing protein [Hyphobacterium sp. CCMP332]|nr:DUF962 domain-containing protein [Hyphobacterium sp. CCMP332]
MRTIDRLLEEYGSSHQNPTNKLIHWICVPAITFSLLGLLWSIPSDFIQGFFPSAFQKYVNFASLFIIFALLYYFRLSIALAIGMIIISYALLWSCYAIDKYLELPLWQFSIIVFVLAWVGQFFGHNIEGKKPSFLKDVQFLLIGPIWLLHFIYKKTGIPY